MQATLLQATPMQANAKQYPEAIIHILWPRYGTKIIEHIPKNE